MCNTRTRTWATGSLSTLAVMAMAMAMVAAGPAEVAFGGERQQVRVVTRQSAMPAERERVSYVPLHRNRPEASQLVVRPVVEPAAVVSRELSEQPVLPHLAEVSVGETTILVDPKVDYRMPTGGIDRNHTIRRAQQLHRAMQPTPPARVIRHPHAGEAPARPTRREPQPEMIFLRPDILGPLPTPEPTPDKTPLPKVQHEDTAPAPQPPHSPIPHVPAPPDNQPDRIAQSK